MGFLERLLLELAAIAVQLAIVKLMAWLRQRAQDADPAGRTQVRLAAA